VSSAQAAVRMLGGEALKLPAFLRRDLLVALSYRFAFVTEWLSLCLQAVTFYFVGRMVDTDKLPTYGGSHATYMEFVAVGIALSAFMQLALGRVANGIRAEQLTGTLESLMMTPTAPATIQLGTVVYDIIYIPLRTGLFLLFVTLAFGLDFAPSGLLPAMAVLLLFIPFVWGLGITSAAITLTVRRGQAFAGFVVTLMTLLSGAYFPLSLMPHWAETIAKLNPIAIAVDGMREPLLGGTGWAGIGHAAALLAPMALVSLVIGNFGFRLALRRERRLGSLGLY
jgi:ABC-2 type transport system permease protein